MPKRTFIPHSTRKRVNKLGYRSRKIKTSGASGKLIALFKRRMAKGRKRLTQVSK